LFAFGEEFSLVSGLDDIGEDEDGDDEVEGGLGHGDDVLTEEGEVGEVAAFGEEHDADDEEDEEAEDFVHAVLLKEGGDMIGEPDHEDAADDDGDGHDPEDIAEGHGAEDGVEGEDEVHEDDPHDDIGGGTGFTGGVFIRGKVHHVEDFLDGGVDDEGAAEEDDEAVDVNLGFEDAGEVEGDDGVLEILNEIDEEEEERDAEEDGDPDAEFSDHGLFVGRGAFGFEGDIEEVVESEHGLEEDEHGKGEEVLDHGVAAGLVWLVKGLSCGRI
jgi:hypothetical protein